MDTGYDSGRGGFDADVASNPIQDDPTTQHEYGRSMGSARYASAEKQLMLAILTDAVGCVLEHKWSRASADALDWIVEKEEGALCSFDNICEVLGLEPDCVRKGILAEVASGHSFPIDGDARRSRRKTVPNRVAA